MASSQNTKCYDDIDLEWLRTRAAMIVNNDRFGEFEALCAAPATVLREGDGGTYGVSLDAAVTEFEKFLALN